MNAESLLRLTHFELQTAMDSVDLQDVVYDLGKRMEAIGLKPMNMEEADNARFAIRELRARISQRKREMENDRDLRI